MPFKFVLISILISLTTSAYANEFNHTESCYEVAEVASASIPTKLCLNSVELNLNSNELTLQSSHALYTNLYKNLSVSQVSRHNEEWISFHSSKVIHNSSIKGTTETLTLKVSGRVDNYGVGFANFVDLNIVQELKSAAGEKTTHVYNYRLIQSH